MSLGEKLNALRRRAGLSQEQLADRLGVTRQSVSKWESGQAAPELGKLVALSELFGVSVDYLVKDGLTEPETRPEGLSRLEAKGAVRCQEGGRAKLYYPALDRRDAARAETESFLGRVYGGSVGSMMSAMVDSRQLTAEDIAELSAILEKAGGGES